MSTEIARPNTGLDDLAIRIKSAHQAVREAAKAIVARAIDAGLALNDARSKLPHGEWLPWLKDNCGLSERTAYNYMLIANNRTKFAIDANLTLTQALRQLREEEPKEAGPASRYDKAQATLLRSLGNLLPDEIESAAKRTIAELEAAIGKPVR